MPPLLRVRGPKLGNSKYVEVSNEYSVGNGSQGSVLKVLIRLPPATLNEMDGPKHGSIPHANDTDGNDDNTLIENDDLDITDFSDDLLSLDMEINKILSSTTTAPANPETQADLQGSKVKQEIIKREESTVRPVNSNSSNEHEYRLIPKNLVTVIQSELLNDDEDIGMIEKMIFSLKDPLSATKISLPVKSTICIHFECFDFDNFCTFSHIPEGIKYVCRKDLVKKNFEKKKSEKREQEMLEKLRRKGDLKTQESELWKKQFYEVSEKLKHQRKGTKLYKSLDSELQLIMNKMVMPHYQADFNSLSAPPRPTKGKFAQPNYPTYRCPICDRMFSLNQLYISDAYNFFVKTTPREVNRVELVDMIKYRILDDRAGSALPKNEEEVIILSDDDDDDDDDGSHSGTYAEKVDKKIDNNDSTGEKLLRNLLRESEDEGDELYNRNSSEGVFDDGLDREFLSLGANGIGSWEDPVTIE